MAKKRITLILDDDTDQDVIGYFEGKSKTDTGLRLIRSGMFLEKADLTDSLLLLKGKGLSAELGDLGLLKKAIEIAELMHGQSGSPVTSNKPEKSEKPEKRKSVFG